MVVRMVWSVMGVVVTATVVVMARGALRRIAEVVVVAVVGGQLELWPELAEAFLGCIWQRSRRRSWRYLMGQTKKFEKKS